MEETDKIKRLFTCWEEEVEPGKFIAFLEMHQDSDTAKLIKLLLSLSIGGIDILEEVHHKDESI